MADWSFQPLGSIDVGSKVISVEPQVSRRDHRKLAVATVTAVRSREAATVIVNGALRCTPDHKFWATGRDAGWREVDRLIGLRARFLVDPPPKQDPLLFARGWLAGFWTMKNRYRRFRLAVRDNDLLERAHDFAVQCGFELRWGSHKLGTDTVNAEARRFEQWLAADVDDDGWRWGHLGGVLDAEGSLSRGVMRIGSTYPRLRQVLIDLNLSFSEERNGFYLGADHGQRYAVIASAKPAKSSILRNMLGTSPRGSRVIEQVAATGEVEPVISLTTTAGSFVADGFLVKNCDSKFTWDWDSYDPKQELWTCTVDEVLQRVEVMNVELVVITGGEPLLQQRQLAPLLAACEERGWRVEVETNGTIAPPVAAARCQWNVSPKLANSGVAVERRYRPAVLRAFEATGRAVFKFVVTGPGDLDEVQMMVDECGLANVWIMPEGTDGATVAAGLAGLAEPVLARGWHLTSRLHILIWGDRRGV
jgi:organic radical activating enzyme